MSSVLDVAVDFGGVSIGDATARLGVKISREVLNPVAADECFCGHRLSGVVVLGHGNDMPGQQTLIDDADIAVDAVFDCKRISLCPKNVSAGLTFNLKDIDVSELAKFSKGSGRLMVNSVAEIPEEDKQESNSEDHVPGTLKAEGPWRDVQLSELFDGALFKSMLDGNLKTVGDLSDYTSSDKRLTDLPNVGAAKAQKIEDRMLHFWADNPQE